MRVANGSVAAEDTPLCGGRRAPAASPARALAWHHDVRRGFGFQRTCGGSSFRGFGDAAAASPTSVAHCIMTFAAPGLKSTRNCALTMLPRKLEMAGLRRLAIAPRGGFPEQDRRGK